MEIPGGDDYKMTIRHLDTSKRTYNNELEELLQEMKEAKEYRVVIDCHVTKIQDILEEVLLYKTQRDICERISLLQKCTADKNWR